VLAGMGSSPGAPAPSLVHAVCLQTVETLGLPAAPNLLDDRDGSVMVPRKWDHVLARAKAALPVPTDSQAAADVDES
jgi:hypothetical protein